jgi:micrococcal nuclease
MDRGGDLSISSRLWGALAACILLAACGGTTAREAGFLGDRTGGAEKKVARTDFGEKDKKPSKPGGQTKRGSQRRPKPGSKGGGEAGSPSRGGRERTTVVDVVDGDTIEVGLGGTVEDVRLIGVDTPETVHPTEPVECFGPRASSYTSTALLGESVRLEFDDERRDHYGRLLAYVWLDGKLFNKTLVARGLAEVIIYSPNDAYADTLLGAESKAQSAGRGMWSACTATSGTGGGGEGGGGVAPAPSSRKGCDPNYTGACIPKYPPDIDCDQAGATSFRSVGSDPHGFDGDDDGVACEG